MSPDKISHSFRAAFLLLAALTVIIFFQTVRFSFLSFDDNVFITENPHVRQGLTASGIRWAFTADLTYDDPNIDYWQPLTALSRMLDVSLFGMDASCQHLVNVVLHILNVWLLFILILSLTRSEAAAFWTAALFAVHPVQVETVAWLAARKDLLAVFFALFSLNAYHRSRMGSGRFTAILSGVFFLFALLSKPAYVFIPLLMVLIDRFFIPEMRQLPAGSFLKNQISGKAFYWAASLGFFLIGRHYAPLGISLDDTAATATNSASAFLIQLGKIFWPAGLGLYESVSARRTFSPAVFGGCVIVLVLLTLLFRYRSTKQPVLFFGWLWFLAALFLTTLLRFPADRFLYLPSAGIFLAVVHLLLESRLPERLSRLVLCVLVLVCGCLSIRQAGFWKNDYYFFNRSLERYPDNFVALGSLGSFYYRQGQVGEAVSYYRRALDANPDDALGHLLLANALKTAGDADGARLAFQEAVRLNPAFEASEGRLGYLLQSGSAPSRLLDKI